MMHKKLALLVVIVLASCAAPVTEAPVPTFPPTSTFTLAATSTSAPAVDSTPTAAVSPTVTVTPDPSMGTVKGDFSWLNSETSQPLPINAVTLQLDRHTGGYIKYKVKSGPDGHFEFSNIEPGEYGFGIYMNLQIKERQCESPEYIFSRDLKWLHYATGLKIDVWYDVLFSSVDITVKPGDVVVLDFGLKCP
jgi:hypothetical protein